MQYFFTLKDNNQKTYNLFTWFLFFLHFIAAALFALRTTNDNIKLSMYILLGFYIICGIVYFFCRKYKKALETFSLIMALLYANFWFIYVSGIAVIIFAAVYLFATLVQGKKTTVLFSENGVHLTGIFKTIIYPWQKMDNVILKDSLLTIDFKSNKLIQAEIIDVSEVIDEINFNLFCSEKLQA
jgi:hypothetical protein